MTLATHESQRTAMSGDSAAASWSRRAWIAFDSPPPGRRVPGSVVVFFLGVTVGAVASAWAVHRAANMDYGDAMAHLTIARRIVDSKTPGLQQLGTVWLPVPHLLLLPLTLSTWLWHTGIAACILGALCLGATASGLYRIMARLGIGGPGRAVALAILLSNVSLVYASTEALTEPVLIASMVCCLAGLAGWAFSRRRLSGGELSVFAGLPAAFAVLSRYEGWALVLSGTVYVAIVCLRRGDTWRQAGVNCCAFAIPPTIAVGWWLAYNFAWYRNPFEFLIGPYSASAFNQVFIAQGRMTTAGNLGLSLQVFGESLIQTAGLIPLILAAVALMAMTLRWGLDNRALTVWLAGTATAFLLFAMVTGQQVIVDSASLPAGPTWNNRNTLSAIPWIALLCACGIAMLPTLRRTQLIGAAVLSALLVLQVGYWAQDPYGRLSVINEGDNGHEAFLGVKEAAHWLRSHYDGGGILMDESSDRLAISPVLGIPMDQIDNRAAGDAFQAAIDDPVDHDRWVFMHLSLKAYASTQAAYDHVAAVLLNDPAFHARYRLVYSIDGFGIYRRLDAPSTP